MHRAGFAIERLARTQIAQRAEQRRMVSRAVRGHRGKGAQRLFEVLELLGRDRALARVRAAAAGR